MKVSFESVRAVVAVTVALATSAACGITDSNALPGTADLYVAVSGSGSVRLIVSDWVRQAEDGSTVLIVADTVDIVSSYQRTLALRQPPSFYAQVTSSGDDSHVAMSVWLDGSLKYQHAETLHADESLRYSYVYAGR